MDLLQFPAELVSYKTYATKSNVQVNFELQEALLPEHIATLLSAKGQTGWLVFSPTGTRIKPEEIPEMPVKEKTGKTQSQRLHSVLFVYHKTLGITESFDSFYQNYMEKVIDSIKAKLPPQDI